MHVLKRIAFLLMVSFESFAQQNFINVPSGELTVKHKLFFQQQLNINNVYQSNSTFDVGLDKNTECGVNVFNVNFSNQFKLLKGDTSKTGNTNPLILFNLLREFKISKHVKFVLGGQTGINYSKKCKSKYADLAYFDLKIDDLIKNGSNFVAGIYYNTRAYGGAGNRFGAWVGMEYPITEKIHFMGESILGNNSISFSSLGIVIYAKKYFPITLAAQIPNQKTNSYAFVLELTFVPQEKK